MRKHFSSFIENLAADNDDLIFITGDLGYNALENLQEKMGSRFINAGVAEQNMIGVAAGMAYKGYRVICYSIAPFVVYRCLEQVRNDVCFHNLPVYVIGNGGGYGYGIMGPSHHAIEDIATLSGLPNMTCYVPAFIEDMNSLLQHMADARRPAYFRLGLGKHMPDWLQLTYYGAASALQSGSAITIIAQGPVADNLMAALEKDNLRQHVDVFVVNRMPFTTLPGNMQTSIAATGRVLVVEEHIAIGGLCSAVSLLMAQHAVGARQFVSLHAQGYPNGLYGSQAYHQQLSGLDVDNILAVIKTMVAG